MIKVDSGRASAGGAAADVQRIQAGPLGLTFAWTGDRYAHALELGVAKTRVVESVEADPLAHDPLRVESPAYQQLHFQEDPQGVFALLLGQAGHHHFSASFRVTEEPGFVAVEVDVADRARGGREALLACTYLVLLPPAALQEAGPACVVWHPPGPVGGRLIVAPRGIARHTTELALAEGPRAAQVQAIANTVPGAPTQRCRFCWKWVLPAECAG